MPRYSYECSSCDRIYDVTHHYKDVLEECIHCEEKSIKRVINKVFIQKKANSKPKVGNKIKDTISETREEIKKYKKSSTQEKRTK
jgi:putative FmdB family regulatory protein